MADGVRVLREWGSGPRRRPWAAAAAGLAAVALLVGTAISPVRWIQPPRFLETVDANRRFSEHRVRQGRILQGLIEQGVLPPDLRIATGGLGALSYYTDWFVVDHHGLTDRFVARLPPTGRLGHEKNVPVSYLAERDVAVVLLSPALVWPSSAPLDRLLEISKQWLEVYNRGAEDPSQRLRPECREVVPELLMIYGTNLDEPSHRRILGHLPPCALPPPWPAPAP